MALLFESVRLGKGLKEMYAFLNFHFGYGSGYLKGIEDFLILNKQADEKCTSLPAEF